MPFNRRVPFFNANKSQQTFDTLRQIELTKLRSNSQKPCGHNHHHQPNGIEIATDELEDLQAEKLFHTICVGNLSSEFLIPCAKNANWVRLEESIINLFKNSGQLIDGQLKQTHEDITALLNSNFGIFVFDRLKSQVLPKAVRLLKSKIDHDFDDDGCDSDGDGKNYLNTLGSVWKTFYHDILSTLECMLFSIESFNNVSIRKTTLVIFRDKILIDSLLEDKLKELIEQNKLIPANIIQMILVVQSVHERYPPSENRLKFEKITALAITPYVGYYGTYENHNQTPIIRSNEPDNFGRNPFEMLNRKNNNTIYGHSNTINNNQHHSIMMNNRIQNNNNRTSEIKNKNNRSRKISLPHFGTNTTNNNKNPNYIISRINE
ncbi:proline-rich protein 5-like isoform X1 [Dermatophagoides pteronyssinus]|uniref:proline-rich protein 5-like isoform X1 n=1 Tax=Dermatophagoides pteronyssinus TaxID=6956 RepID=UPI003F676D4E